MTVTIVDPALVAAIDEAVQLPCMFRDCSNVADWQGTPPCGHSVFFCDPHRRDTEAMLADLASAPLVHCEFCPAFWPKIFIVILWKPVR